MAFCFQDNFVFIINELKRRAAGDATQKQLRLVFGNQLLSTKPEHQSGAGAGDGGWSGHGHNITNDPRTIYNFTTNTDPDRRAAHQPDTGLDIRSTQTGARSH